MNLNDLFVKEGLDPTSVVVLRHRPHEPEIRKILPWLAAEKPEHFNAYQQTQGDKLEGAMKRMSGSGYVASFIGNAPGKALFIGIYSIGSSKPLTYSEYWDVPAYAHLKEFGLHGFQMDSSRKSILWFDLALTGILSAWKGKLVVGWPPPERSWWRRSHRNEMPILSISEESALDAAMPPWEKIALSWDELKILPTRWKSAISHWRGVYYIYDSSDGKGYVGSAYGIDNLYGRWLNYSLSGHGGNKFLRLRDPKNFNFSILQRVSPDMSEAEITQLESSWKDRLHTRAPDGLNDN